MGQVFLSYSSEDRDEAGKVVQALRSRGIDVWWDVDRRHEVDEWSPDIEKRLHSAYRIVSLVTRNVIESPRDYVFAEMLVGRQQLKLIALHIGDTPLPYKYQSVMVGINRRAYRSFRHLLEAEALDDICAACGAKAAGEAEAPAGGSGPLGGDLCVERVALAIATAALEELPVTTAIDAATSLETRLRAAMDKEGSPPANRFRARADRLREIGAVTFEITHPRLDVPVQCVRFADPRQRFAVLEYAWDELDGLRGTLLDWLDALAASPSPDVRASIGMVVGVLARTRLVTVLEQVLARWILASDPALREVADLAFRVALDAPDVERAISTQVRDWARGGSLPPVRAAIELACGYTGSRLPDLGIETLKIVAKTGVSGVDAASLIHAAVDHLTEANREAADGSLFDLSKLLKGLCAWADEALPQKEHKMLPLILFFELVSRLPLRSPRRVPGVFSLQAATADPDMRRALTHIFDLALRSGGPVSTRDLARNCLKRLCRRAEELAKRGLLADDPVLHLARDIYRASPADRDRDRLAYAVERTYPRSVLESDLSQLTDARAGAEAT